MSEKNDIASRVRSMIVTHFRVDEDAVTDEKSLIDDLGGDSLDVVELIMDAEDSFEVEITDDEAEGMNSVGDAIKLIERKVHERAAV